MIAPDTTEAGARGLTQEDSDTRAWMTPVVYFILTAVTLSPLLWVQVPPLVDYPNHLARMWIIAHHADNAELARNYVIHWRILPDMGMDLIVLMLSHVMPVVAAGRVFVGLAMLGLVGGTITLHRALYGRYALWPIWSVLFVYNTVLFFGFVDCLFASGLYLLTFSGWIASRRWHPAPRILLFSILAAGLFLMHLFAFGLYGLSIATYEFGQRLNQRRPILQHLRSYILVCLQFVPGLLLWYLSLANVRSTHTAYGHLAVRIKSLFAPVKFGYSLSPFDGVMWGALTVFLLFSISRRALRVAPEMKLPLAALVLTAVAIPDFLNGSQVVAIRIPVVLAFVTLAASEIRVRDRLARNALVTMALVLLTVRVWTVTETWQDYGHWFNEFRDASKVISPGSRLMVVESDIPEKRRELPGVPRILAFIDPLVFSHMGALAVIDRSAYFPYLFTQATPLAVTQRNRSVAQTVSDPISPLAMILTSNPRTERMVVIKRDYYGQMPYWRNWPRTMDYVLWIDFGTAKNFHFRPLKLAAAGSFFRIFRVIRKPPGSLVQNQSDVQ